MQGHGSWNIGESLVENRGPGSGLLRTCEALEDVGEPSVVGGRILQAAAERRGANAFRQSGSNHAVDNGPLWTKDGHGLADKGGFSPACPV
ncbi:hypothetical protein D3C80_2090240 [compost metagenome]